MARFNDTITGRLLEGALDTLRRSGVDVDKDVEVFWVPGAFELPVAAQKVARTKRFDAIVGRSPAIERLLQVLAKAAAGTAPILLSGDSGASEVAVLSDEEIWRLML